MEHNPLVSICIPTFNRAGFLENAITSALQQTYGNIEVIVIDNASTDNTQEIITRFSDPRLKYFKNSENLGLFGNFNRCIEQAQGEYIHILHSDDTIDPFFTERCIKFFQNNPTVKMTTTSARIISENSIRDSRFSEMDFILKAPEGLKYLFLYRNFIVCPSVMVHRDVYRDVGGYSLEYPYSSDLYQWFKILKKYDIGYVSEIYLNYRQGIHSESYRLLFKSPAGYLDVLKIIIRIEQEIGDDRLYYNTELTAFLRQYIKDCLFAGFVRSDAMQSVRPSVFIGIAFSAWSLITPKNVRETCSKYGYLILIGISNIAMSVGPFRHYISRCITNDVQRY